MLGFPRLLNYLQSYVAVVLSVLQVRQRTVSRERLPHVVEGAHKIRGEHDDQEAVHHRDRLVVPASVGRQLAIGCLARGAVEYPVCLFAFQNACDRMHKPWGQAVITPYRNHFYMNTLRSDLDAAARWLAAGMAPSATAPAAIRRHSMTSHGMSFGAWMLIGASMMAASDRPPKPLPELGDSGARTQEPDALYQTEALSGQQWSL